MFKFHFILFGLTIIFIQTAFGQNISIDPNYAGGLRQAIDDINGNGIITLESGTYINDRENNGNCSFSNIDISSGDLTIEGETGNPADVIIDLKKCGRFLRFIGGSNYHISGITIKNGDTRCRIQVKTIENNQLYRITLDTVDIDYYSSSTATESEILQGLKGSIESSVNDIIVTNDTLNVCLLIERIPYTPFWDNVSCSSNLAIPINYRHLVDGGGIRINNASSPLIEKCVFINCYTQVNGGVMFMGIGSPSIKNCIFENNYAGKGYGAIYIKSIASPSIVDCIFDGNQAKEHGGAIGVTSYYITNIEGCKFINNMATTTTSGAIQVTGYGGALILNCDFKNNFGVSGGCISILNNAGFINVSGCNFENNQSNIGAAIYLLNGSNVQIENSTMNDNSASEGGAVYCSASSPTINNCIFWNNSANNTGGSIYFGNGSTSIISNSTFWNNDVNNTGGAIYCSGNSTSNIRNAIFWENFPDEVKVTGDSMLDIKYSAIMYGYSGEGNIDQNPKFESPETGIFRLLSDSPCIDAGDNNAVPTGVLIDISGTNRFIDHLGTEDTGKGIPPIVDMGPYEYVTFSSIPATSSWGLVALFIFIVGLYFMVMSKEKGESGVN